MILRQRRLAKLLALIIVLTGIILISGGSAGGGTLSQAVIDPRVLADTANGKISNFLVVFKSQADLAAIAEVNSASNPALQWKQLGLSVTSALEQVARTSQTGVISILKKSGAAYHSFWIVNDIAVSGDRRLVNLLATQPEVARIESDQAFGSPLEYEQNALPSNNLPRTIQFNLTQIHATDLWAKGVTGVGAVVASSDTGVMWDHPALKTHYRGWDSTTGQADHNYNWWDAIHSGIVSSTGNSCGFNSPFPCDDSGHGTHTTGIMVGDDGKGDQVGVAPGAKWIACRNMDRGVGRPSTYIECLEFFAKPTDLNGQNGDPNKRPFVINNSYGCPLGPPPGEYCLSDSLHQAVENVRAAGIFMAVSAGNDGRTGCSTVNSPPAIEQDVFTTGAVDSTNQIADFSSRGPITIDGSNRLKPNLVAPGVGIFSSLSSGSFGYMSGTSMAGPHVAGAVALLWSAFPFLMRDVRSTEFILEFTADPLYPPASELCGKDTTLSHPNNVYGYGMLNVISAYTWSQTNRVQYLELPFISN